MKQALILHPSAAIFLYMKFPFLIGEDYRDDQLTEEHAL